MNIEIEQAYKTAAEKRKKAKQQQAQQKLKEISREKTAVNNSEQQDLLQAYAQKLRADGVLEQQLRQEGITGGQREQQKLVKQAAFDTLQKDIKKAAAEKNEQLTASQREEEQKEQQELATIDASLAEKQASSIKSAQSKALSMMRMGIYDASFASLLGISDKEVRDYIKKKKK